MADILNIKGPPEGFKRSPRKGWLKRKGSPTNVIVGDLKKENADLKDRLAQLEEAVAALTSKKSKK